MINSYEDRALSEHRGSALLMKKPNGKYSILIPVEGTGENGSTPAQLEKTAIGNRQASSVEGRTENPQKTIPFYWHRDNVNILEKIKGESHDFLRLFPDMTGIKYSGKVSYMANNTDVGSLEQGQITITPETADEYIDNCFGLVEDTVVFTNAIDEVITISASSSAADHTKAYSLTTNPTGASFTVASDTTGTATVALGTGANSNVATITGVAAGSAIIKFTATLSGYASFDRTVLVIVK